MNRLSFIERLGVVIYGTIMWLFTIIAGRHNTYNPIGYVQCNPCIFPGETSSNDWGIKETMTDQRLDNKFHIVAADDINGWIDTVYFDSTEQIRFAKHQIIKQNIRFVPLTTRAKQWLFMTPKERHQFTCYNSNLV